MDLSVVIVNWNSGDHLGRLLDSLSPLREELRETWVVDNASWDSSMDGFENYPSVRILALTENLGLQVLPTKPFPAPIPALSCC